MKRIALIVAVLGVLIGTAYVVRTMISGSADTAGDKEDNESVLVKLTPLQKGSAPVSVVAFGTVEPSYESRQTVSAPLDARVVSVMVRDSQTITKGTPMVTLIPSPQTRAAYALAKQLAERTRALAKAHLATAAELAKAESDFSVLEEEGASGPTTIKAPFDAVVMKIDAGPGAVVTQGAFLIDLARPNDLTLEVGVMPTQAIAIKPGNKVEITPLGATNQKFSGMVRLSGASIDPDTNLVPIEVTVPPDKVLPGEMARASITTGQVEGYVVPHEAVLVDDDGSLYVVQAVEMVAKKVKVKVLASADGKDVVEGDDFEAGSPIVLSGNHQLDDDMKVRLSNEDADSKGAVDIKAAPDTNAAPDQNGTMDPKQEKGK